MRIKVALSLVTAVIVGVFGPSVLLLAPSHEQAPEVAPSHSAGATADAGIMPEWRCLNVKVSVARGQWHLRGENICPTVTQRLYVRMAFYDSDGMRSGFAYVTVEPLRPDEGFRVEGPLPRDYAVSGRVFEIKGGDFKPWLEW